MDDLRRRQCLVWKACYVGYDFQRACDANEIVKEIVTGQIYVEYLQSGLVRPGVWMTLQVFHPDPHTSFCPNRCYHLPVQPHVHSGYVFIESKAWIKIDAPTQTTHPIMALKTFFIYFLLSTEPGLGHDIGKLFRISGELGGLDTMHE